LNQKKTEEVWQNFQALVKKREYEKAYKIIHPKLREYATNVDTHLVTFGSEVDSLIKFELDQNWLEIQFYTQRGSDRVWRNVFIIEDDENYYLTRPWHALTLD